MEKEKMDEGKRKKKTFKTFGKVILIILAVLVLLCLSAYIYIMKVYKLDKIQVTGSVHYTDEEIIEIVTSQIHADNTISFYLDNKFHPVENVTFIDKFEIEVLDKNTVTITVYEKSMAGCVMYMDQYVYFDDDGTVLETSSIKLEDVPCIDGLRFESIVVGEVLPVDDQVMFQQILTMTQLIEKNQLVIDEIRYNSSNEIILYKDDIKIELGDGSNLEDKLMNLDSILSQIQGKKGTLDMSDYSAENGNAIFKENK